MHRLSSLTIQSIAVVGSDVGDSVGKCLLFKVTLQDGLVGAFKARQPFEDFRSEVAAFHIDRLFNLGRTPPSVERAIPLTQLREAVANLALFDDRITPYAIDGLVEGSLTMWLEGLYDATPADPSWRERLALKPSQWTDDWLPVLSSLSDLICFDFLIDNRDRWSSSNMRGFRGGVYGSAQNGAPGGLDRSPNTFSPQQLAQDLVLMDHGEAFRPGVPRTSAHGNALASMRLTEAVNVHLSDYCAFSRTLVDQMKRLSVEIASLPPGNVHCQWATSLSALLRRSLRQQSQLLTLSLFDPQVVFNRPDPRWLPSDAGSTFASPSDVSCLLDGRWARLRERVFECVTKHGEESFL